MSVLNHLVNVFPASGLPVGFAEGDATHVVDIDSDGKLRDHNWFSSQDDSIDGGLGRFEPFAAPIVGRTSGTAPRYVDDLEYTFGVPVVDKDAKKQAANVKRAQIRQAAWIQKWQELRAAHEHGCCTINADYIDPMLAFIGGGVLPPAFIVNPLPKGFTGDVLITVDGTHPFDVHGFPFPCAIEEMSSQVDGAEGAVCSVCGKNSVSVNWREVSSPKFGTASLWEQDDIARHSPTCGECLTQAHYAWRHITRSNQVRFITTNLRAKNRPPVYYFLYTGDDHIVPSTDNYVDNSVLSAVESLVSGGRSVATLKESDISGRPLYFMSLTKISSGLVATRSLDTVDAADAAAHARQFDDIRTAGGTQRPASLVEMTDLLMLDALSSVEHTCRMAVLGEAPPSGTLLNVVRKFARVADANGEQSDFLPKAAKAKAGAVRRRQAIRLAILQHLLNTQSKGQSMEDSRGTTLGNIAKVADGMYRNYHNNERGLIAGNLSTLMARPLFLMTTLLPRAVKLNNSAKKGPRAGLAYYFEKELATAMAGLTGIPDLNRPLTAEESAEFLLAFYSRTKAEAVEDGDTVNNNEEQ